MKAKYLSQSLRWRGARPTCKVTECSFSHSWRICKLCILYSPHSQSVRKQLRCEKLENKIWTGTHLLSLGQQGTWQNNDGDTEEHWGDLHLTNWCLLACHVIFMLEEDCHILAHFNVVIRQLAPQSSAFIRRLTEEEKGEDETMRTSILAHGKRHLYIFYNRLNCSVTTSTVLRNSTHFVHRQTGLTANALAEDSALFTQLYASQFQTFASSSCPFIFFRGLQKWVWNHSLKRPLIGVLGSVICN